MSARVLSRACATFLTGLAIAACASQPKPPPPPPQAASSRAEASLRKLPGVPDEPLALAIFKQKRELMLLRDGVPQRAFQVQLGANPRGHKIWRGDRRTPEGVYHVCTIKASRFKTFLWLSYPNESDARKAYRSGQITAAEYDRILAALKEGRCPPADTPLGGVVGIHGDDQEPPRHYDWTQGCIAVPAGRNLAQLVSLVRPGTPVVIFP